MTTCKTCPAEILWVHTANGSMMPVDAAPNPGGNVLVMRTATGLHGYVLGKDRQPDPRGTLHTTHWATCPNPPKRKRERR